MEIWIHLLGGTSWIALQEYAKGPFGLAYRSLFTTTSQFWNCLRAHIKTGYFHVL